MRLLSRIQAGGESGEPIGLYHRRLADHALRGRRVPQILPAEWARRDRPHAAPRRQDPRLRSAAQSPVSLVFLMKLALRPAAVSGAGCHARQKDHTTELQSLTKPVWRVPIRKKKSKGLNSSP